MDIYVKYNNSRGQTVIRKQFHLSSNDRLEWIVDQNGIRVVPVTSDSIRAFRAQGKGGSGVQLLADRANDSLPE